MHPPDTRLCQLDWNWGLPRHNGSVSPFPGAISLLREDSRKGIIQHICLCFLVRVRNPLSVIFPYMDKDPASVSLILLHFLLLFISLWLLSGFSKAQSSKRTLLAVSVNKQRRQQRAQFGNNACKEPLLSGAGSQDNLLRCRWCFASAGSCNSGTHTRIVWRRCHYSFLILWGLHES